MIMKSNKQKFTNSNQATPALIKMFQPFSFLFFLIVSQKKRCFFSSVNSFDSFLRYIFYYFHLPSIMFPILYWWVKKKWRQGKRWNTQNPWTNEGWGKTAYLEVNVHFEFFYCFLDAIYQYFWTSHLVFSFLTIVVMLRACLYLHTFIISVEFRKEKLNECDYVTFRRGNGTFLIYIFVLLIIKSFYIVCYNALFLSF